MPRADAKLFASQHHHSPYPTQVLSDTLGAPSSSSSGLAHRTIVRAGSSPSPPPRKKHVCPTCDRSFSTSGHLARHSRIHTGERNHKCPFPGCETRCSRQDNLQQHYRIHFSPGSRRSRANVLRTKNDGASAKGKRSASASDGYSSASSAAGSSTPPALEVAHPQLPHSPPPLESARGYPQSISPPDSPPPLAHATLPATAHLMDGASRSSSHSPQAPFSVPNSLLDSGANDLQQYHYRSSVSYHEQPLSYPYIDTPPVSGSQTPVNDTPSPYSTSYPSPQQEYSLVSLPSRDASPVSNTFYPYSGASGTQTSSSSSQSLSLHFSSQANGPYPTVYEDSPSSTSSATLSSQNTLVQDGYPVHSGRFASSSPTLAPIQGTRFVQRNGQERRASVQYLHHPQPMSNDFTYHQSMGMGHNAWKAESPMLRKGFATLVQ